MIISHKHKFIFIKTRKTASTTIEIVLSGICGPQDVLTPLAPEDEQLRKQRIGIVAQNIHIPWNRYTILDYLRLIKNLKRARYYNHMPAKDVRHYVGRKIWESYYVFCFERFPTDKFISHYLWRGKRKHYPNVAAYIASKDYQLIQGKRYYQSKTGELLVDKVFKMEQMQNAFKEIRQKLKLADHELAIPEIVTKKSEPRDTALTMEVQQQYLEKLKTLFPEEYNFYKSGKD